MVIALHSLLSLILASLWAGVLTLALHGETLLFGGAFLSFLVICLLMFARARAWGRA